MNKRQKKKRIKIVQSRYDYLSKIIIIYGRKSGKTRLLHRINSAVHSKKYKPFEQIKKELKEGRIK